jgi:hypothetical protein
MLVERVSDRQCVAVGTIKQRRSLNVSEGLCGQEAVPWVAFKEGRKIHTQGGDSELIEV